MRGVAAGSTRSPVYPAFACDHISAALSPQRPGQRDEQPTILPAHSNVLG